MILYKAKDNHHENRKRVKTVILRSHPEGSELSYISQKVVEIPYGVSSAIIGEQKRR